MTLGDYKNISWSCIGDEDYNTILSALKAQELLEEEKEHIGKEMRSAKRGGADVYWNYKEQYEILEAIIKESKK